MYTYNICQFNKLLNYFLCCNEHVEMNTFLCSLACTWMKIDSQFYIIDSKSLDVALE